MWPFRLISGVLSIPNKFGATVAQRRIYSADLGAKGCVSRVFGQTSKQKRFMLITALVLVFGTAVPAFPFDSTLSWSNPLGPGRVEAAAPAGSRFFPQTGFQVSNKDGVNFLSEFERLGGVQTLGFPVSRVFETGGFLHQGFQRGILQWRSVANSAVLVNIMDQLNNSGKDEWLLLKGIPRHSSSDDGSRGDFNKAKETRLSWLTNLEIRRTYLSNPDPISFYGLPTSNPQRHGPFIAQRFQRGALQLWVDNVQDMPRPGEVVGVLAGDLAKGLGFFTAQAVEPESPEPEVELMELILPVPAFRQERNLSCEASAAAMAASYFGVALPERQIVAELPRDPNPHKGFRGNIDGLFGWIDDYGVYAEPIAKILTKHGLKAEVVYDLSLESLRKALAQDKLVVAWITLFTSPQKPILRDINGAKVNLVPSEHTVVVKGYDQRGVFVNDPATGRGGYYSNEDFLRASGYFSGMAVVVSK